MYKNKYQNEAKTFMKRVFSLLNHLSPTKLLFTSKDELNQAIHQINNLLKNEMTDEDYIRINDLFLRDSISRSYYNFEYFLNFYCEQHNVGEKIAFSIDKNLKFYKEECTDKDVVSVAYILAKYRYS